MKRPTIADVAARAGVSRSTVSYALSNKRPISEETRQRIQQAIEELSFRPNPVAQRLASREQSRNIGFVLPLTTGEMTGLELKFITGASKIINQMDYTFILLAHSDRSPENLLRFAQSGLVDGFILLEVYMHDKRVDLLREEGVPFVLLGRCEDNSGLSYVDTDIRQTMEDCFSHLTGNGRYSIAYIYNENDEYGFSVRALREYQAACQRYNTTPILKPAHLTPEDGETAMNTLLEQHPDLDAAIIYSDIPAMGAVRAVQSRGRQIPSDFSIICQEHSIISNLESFSPVVIDICADELAAQAAQLMINQLEGKTIAQPQLLVPSQLIISEGDTI